MSKKYYKPSRYRTSASQSQTLWVFFLSILFIFGFLHHMNTRALIVQPTTEETERTTLLPAENADSLIENTHHQYTPRFHLN